MGSVVSGPFPITEVLPNKPPVVYVTIMWEDDYTFSVHDVQELAAFPLTVPKGEGNVVPMVPGGGNETSH